MMTGFRTSIGKGLAVLLAVSVAGLSGCGSEDSPSDASSSTLSPLGESGLIPFPSQAPVGYEAGTVIRLQQAVSDYAWGGRRASDDIQSVSMFRPNDGGEPVFLASVADDPEFSGFDAGSEWFDQTLGNRRFRDATDDQPNGVPLDAVALSVMDTNGIFTIAQRDSNPESLLDLVSEVEVSSNGVAMLKGDAGMEAAGSLEQNWTAPKGAVFANYEPTSQRGEFEEIQVMIRTIDEAESSILLELGNRDPDSLRSAASIDLEPTSQEPIQRTVGEDTVTISTVASGTRALINQASGYAIFTTGNAIGPGFASNEALVEIASGLEFLPETEFLEQAEARQAEFTDRLLSEDTRQNEFCDDPLWKSSANPSRVQLCSSNSDFPLELVVFDPSENLWSSTRISVIAPNEAGIGAGIAEAFVLETGTDTFIGGVAPEGTASVVIEAEGNEFTTDAISTGLDSYPNVFYVPLNTDDYSTEVDFSVTALDAQGQELGTFVAPPRNHEGLVIGANSSRG